MNVNQAGHERSDPEVDDLGSLRMLNRGTYLNNAFVLYEDFARSDYFPIFNIEKPRGMEDYRVLRSGWR